MNHLSRLIPYLKIYRKKLYLGIIVIFLSAVFTNLIPFFVSKAIDSIKSHPDTGMLITYAILTVIFAVLSGVFLYLTRQTIIIVSREIENDLRNDFLSHVLVQDIQYFHRNPTGDLMALATNDISAVRNFLGPGIMYTAETILHLIMSIVLMLSLNIQLTLIALIPIPVISFIVYRIGKSVNQNFEMVQDQFGSLTTKVQEFLSGIKVIKSYVREKSEYNSFYNASLTYMKRNMKLAKVQSFSYPLMFLLTSISTVIVLFIGGNKIIDGELTIGELTAFIIYLGLLTWPMIAFGWIVNLTQRSNASMKRLIEVFDARPVIKENNETDYNIKTIEGMVEFRNINFRYGNNLSYVLKDINLKIEKGETLGIIGHTGSGKSTLVNLIPRLFEIDEGELLIDGINVKKYPIGVLRRSIGTISQETFLFSDSIESNIAYGLDDRVKDKIISSAKVSQIYRDIDSFPGRFETILGERGINLSGGQKQRTSIARAIAIDPKILILDDAFSAVDTYTEEEILVRLKEIMKERTTLLISHRVSTIKNADRIIVLKDGCIAETGTHASLIQQEGIYADIYFKQLLEEELKDI